MRAVCAWCQAEGRANAFGEKAPLDDPTETHGICGPHQLDLLLKTEPRGDGHEQFLVVVGRPERERFTRVSEACLDDPRFTVLIDRRRGERRWRAESVAMERRRGERRRQPGYWDDLQYHSLIVTPVRGGAEVLAPTGATSAAGSHLEDGGASDLSGLIEGWLRESREIAGRLLPALLREHDSWRQRAEIAEERGRQLSRTVSDLQEEITKRQTEIDRLQHRLREAAQAVQTSLEEISRVANDLLWKVKRGP